MHRRTLCFHAPTWSALIVVGLLMPFEYRAVCGQGVELVNLKLDSTQRAYDTVANPPSGVKQDFSIPKIGFMTVVHSLEPYPAKSDGGLFRIFPIAPKNGPDWEARHHLGTVVLNELMPKDAKPGDKRVHKIVYRVQPTPAEIMIAARLAPPLVFQAFQIGNRGEQLGAVQQLTVTFVPFEDYSKQDTAAPGLDVSGTWTHGDPFGETATWTFTPKGAGEYEAIEKGFDNAHGTAKVRGNKIYIDWVSTTAKGGKQRKGITVIDIDSSNKAGGGYWIGDAGEGGVRIWTSTPAKPIGIAAVPPPSVPPPSAPPTSPPPKPTTDPATPPPAGVAEPASVSRFTIQAGRREGKPGEVITVPVYLLNPDGLANLNLTLGYSSGIARVEEKIVRGNVLGSALFESNAGEADQARIGIAGNKALSESGILAHVPFKLVGKPGDRAELKVVVGTANRLDGAPLKADVIDGEILILDDSGGVPGDSDGDRTLTAGDALAALKMSVKLLPEKKAADADGDGQVTSNDARLILQKVVGK